MVHLMEKVFPGFKSTLGGLWEWVKGLFKGFIDWFWNNLIKPLASIWEGLGLGSFGVKLDTKQNDPRAAYEAERDDRQEQWFGNSGMNQSQNALALNRLSMASGGGAGGGIGLNQQLVGAVSGDRAAVKNYNVNVDKLVEGGINIHTTNVRESATEIQGIVERAILTALNDANYAF
jgi:hypothetical protein